MGKDLKGKELGVGISQRKDGKYTARFTRKDGKRVQKYFDKLQECRNWLADAQFDDEHGIIEAGANMTVDKWYDYWISKIKGDSIRPRTRSAYDVSYEFHISPYIGKMALGEVKPLHCQNVLNIESKKSTGGTNTLIRRVMSMLFSAAVENELISRNPVKKSVQFKAPEVKHERRVLTREEQKQLLEYSEEYSCHNVIAFLLQTGIRVGELVALKWEDISFSERQITISRTAGFDAKNNWVEGPTKTANGQRIIPMTEEAYRILRNQKEQNANLGVVNIQWADRVFLSRNGTPIRAQTFTRALYKISLKMKVERFSAHTLRHTFATRCIEAGMRPKTLQRILGHSSLSITMNLYVHVSEDEKKKEMLGIEESLKVV